MRHTRRSWIVVLSAAASLTPAALGQWSSNSAANNVVAGGSNDQTVCIIRPSLTGGAWFTYMENLGGQYSPFVQRVDSLGTKLLGASGVQVANRTNTATFVYDMNVDAQGNAYISFDNSGTYVQKIAPDGSLPWGFGGVLLPNSATFGSQVAACADGTVVVAWSISNVLNFQRVNADGTLANAWTLAETGRYQAMSDLLAVGTGGDVVALWVRGETTNVTSSRKGLKIQKFNSGGTAQWNAGVALDVMTSTGTAPTRSIQNGYFPGMVSDGRDGAVIAWYDIGTNIAARLQHVLSDGSLRFVQDGLICSTTAATTERRRSAAVAFHQGATPAQDEYTIAWEKSNSGQSQFGLGAERVNATGSLLWNAGAGVEVVPFSGNPCSFINVNPSPAGKATITWLQYTGGNGPMTVAASKRNANDGAASWTTPILSVASVATTKGRLAVTGFPGSSMLVVGWQDGPDGSKDILAQNINTIGTIGPACVADVDDGSNAGQPDSGVGIEDLLYFLAQFEAGSAFADVDDGTGNGIRDGGVGIEDLLYYLGRFEAGC